MNNDNQNKKTQFFNEDNESDAKYNRFSQIES